IFASSRRIPTAAEGARPQLSIVRIMNFLWTVCSVSCVSHFDSARRALNASRTSTHHISTSYRTLDSLPSVGAVDIAETQRASFQITELVEHEQRMIAGAGVMAVPDAHLLLAVSRTDARIHVEHDATRRPPTVHQVNPLAGQVGQGAEVGLYGKPLRLEATHLAWRSRAALRRLATDDPAHCRIMTQTFGIVHVLVASQTAEHRLPQQTNQRMATVPTSARIREPLACHRGQPECVIE